MSRLSLTSSYPFDPILSESKSNQIFIIIKIKMGQVIPDTPNVSVRLVFWVLSLVLPGITGLAGLWEPNGRNKTAIITGAILMTAWIASLIIYSVTSLSPSWVGSIVIWIVGQIISCGHVMKCVGGCDPNKE